MTIFKTKNEQKNYKSINFMYNNYEVRVWSNGNLAERYIKNIILNVLEQKICTEVLYDIRNQIILVKNNTLDFINRDIVIKEFRLSRNYDKIRFRFITSKALRSFNAAIKLKKIGLKTPEPIMAVEIRGRLNELKTSYYITEYIDFDYNMLSIIRNAEHPLRDRVIEFLPDIARDLKNMHDEGMVHNDMHVGNILIKSIDNPEFYYIDLNRARYKKNIGLHKRMKDLARFDLAEEELDILIQNYDKERYDICIRELLRQREKRQRIRNVKRAFRQLFNIERNI